MFKKLLIFLLGALSASFLRWLFTPPILLDDAATHFGELQRLRYPSGQAVPPGEVFFRRVLRTRQPIQGAEYLVTNSDGEERRIRISASLAPGYQSVFAVMSDITAQRESEREQEKTAHQQKTLAEFSRRLSALEDEEKINTAIVEGALALVTPLPEARARLFSFANAVMPLTLIASAPDERPKRPRTLRESAPETIPFDAASPLIWQLYIARQPVIEANEIHLPLLIGSAALGHLSVRTSASHLEILALWAALAGLARSRISVEKTGARQRQELIALHTVGQAASASPAWDALADIATAQACIALGCAVCILAIFEAGAETVLRVRGEIYRDALLFPETDPALLCDAITCEAASGEQIVVRNSLTNPPLGGSPWSAFAGQSGQHSIVSAPLKQGAKTWGALTVYSADVFTPSQVAFVETLSSLLVNR